MNEVSTTEPLWRQIAAALRGDLEAGRYGPGDRLPSETALAARFGVNRHTLRRALKALAEEGRLHIRRGAGAFVTAERLDYAIGPRVRFSATLADLGREPGRRLLRLETVRAGATEAAALDLRPGAPVVVAEAVAEADGTPLVYAESVFPQAGLPGLAAALAAEPSITAALRKAGVADYLRLWTRVGAVLPGPVKAGHLRMAPNRPCLETESVNADLAGRPVEYGRAWFCADRVQLRIDRDSFPEETEESADDRDS